MILRLEVNGEGLTVGWLYSGGQEICQTCQQNMAEAAKVIDQKLKNNWQSVTGIYIFRGPAGYSRLRSTHSFALALKMALVIPLQPYTLWQSQWACRTPRDSSVIKPIYRA